MDIKLEHNIGDTVYYIKKAHTYSEVECKSCGHKETVKSKEKKYSIMKAEISNIWVDISNNSIKIIYLKKYYSDNTVLQNEYKSLKIFKSRKDAVQFLKSNPDDKFCSKWF